MCLMTTTLLLDPIMKGKNYLDCKLFIGFLKDHRFIYAMGECRIERCWKDMGFVCSTTSTTTSLLSYDWSKVILILCTEGS